ncbi:hypothetical protein AYO20_04183 [Fonsecaea nubica]|uniref:DNA2/NAM7 helicase-like C-terminal domain-containing protein n=1 Tax=Fonsecaea nubica TaxID=856822 RepID=A0A178D4E5_9EURO|nr:hypothetical protein AYO20_04183 [Fonsecaea nubica]OAL36567.1 hypothetical protein AYO20_04183 [Fonsecaea nubica]
MADPTSGMSWEENSNNNLPADPSGTSWEENSNNNLLGGQVSNNNTWANGPSSANDAWGKPSDQDDTAHVDVSSLPSIDLKTLPTLFKSRFAMVKDAQSASFTKKATPKPFEISSAEMQSGEKPQQMSSRITQKGFKAKPPRAEKPGKPAKVWEQKGQDIKEDEIAALFDESSGLAVETVFGIEAYAAGTPWPCTIIDIQTGEQLHGADADVRIAFICDKHISHIQVVVARPSINFPEVADYRAVLRFSADAVTQLNIVEIQHEEFQQHSPANRCFALIINYELGEVNSESFLIPNAPPQIQRLKDHMRAKQPLIFHICGSVHTLENYAALHQQLAVDQAIHPLTKWICPGKSKFVMQKEEFIPKAKRPENCIVAAKNSYFSYDELLVSQCIGDLQEREYVLDQLTTYEAKLHNLYVFELVKGANRAFLGLLDVPVEDQIRLQGGDSLYISDPAIEDEDCCLHATVAEAIPGLPSTLVPLHVTNYYDRENNTFGHPSLKITPIPLSAQDSLAKNLKALRAAPSMKVKIVFDKDEQVYKDKVVGMNLLHEWFSQHSELAIAFQQFILGNDYENIPSFNIFEPILSVIPNPKEIMHALNEGQSQAIDFCMNAPAGAPIIKGPPGTGKTYVGTEISRPFVRAGLDEVHVLVASNANKPIDTFALRLHQMIMSENNPHAYLIRIFSFSTEKDIATRISKLEARKAGKARNHRPTLVEELQPEEREAFECLQFSMAAYENYQREHTYEVELVPDERVSERCLQLATGTRMLQVIGKIPAGKGDPAPQPQEFHEFSSLYQQLCNGTELQKDTKAVFRAQLKKLMNHVISNATIICTTSSLAIQNKYASACKEVIKLVVLEEAARIEQSEALSLRANYPHAVGFVQIGDIQQLRTFVAAPAEAGNFVSQLTRSLMYRSVASGAPSAMLTVQHRMDRDISRCPNELSYEGKLIDHQSVSQQSRPFTQQVRNWNKERFGRGTTAVLIDIHETMTEESPTKSRYNKTFVKYGINLAKDLVDKFPTKSVSIFVYYGAQYLLYLAALDRLRLVDDKYSKIYVDKVDRIQGYECDFVITDMPVRGNGGFLKELNRLNVAHTRARYGFYYIIDRSAVFKTRSPPIMRVVKSYIKSGIRHSITMAEQLIKPIVSPYFEENMVDFSSGQANLPGGDGWDEQPRDSRPPTAQEQEEAAAIEKETNEHIKAEEEQGHTEEEQGHTEEEQGHTGEEQGHTGEEQGHTGEEQGHTGEEQGHTGEEQGHTGEEQGRPEAMGNDLNSWMNAPVENPKWAW